MADTKRKKPLGGGSPRFRASNRAEDGSFPVPPMRPAKQIDISEHAEEDIALLRDRAAHEAIRTLRWQMLHAPSLKAKERAARKLAELGVPKPPQRVEQTGAAGGPIAIVISPDDAKL